MSKKATCLRSAIIAVYKIQPQQFMTDSVISVTDAHRVLNPKCTCISSSNSLPPPPRLPYNPWKVINQQANSVHEIMYNALKAEIL